MITHVHITYPEEGLDLADLKKVISVLEEGSKRYHDPEQEAVSAKVLSVQQGSIDFEMYLPILLQSIPKLISLIKRKFQKHATPEKEVEISFDLKLGIFNFNFHYYRKVN